MAARLCLDCNTLTAGTRCPPCQSQHNARDWQRRPLTAAERQRRANAVKAHIEHYGDICPGWHCDPHLAYDLTADHIHPVAAGGSEAGDLTVLCRSCNSRKGATPGIPT